jgi:hypothetical protein
MNTIDLVEIWELVSYFDIDDSDTFRRPQWDQRPASSQARARSVTVTCSRDPEPHQERI